MAAPASSGSMPTRKRKVATIAAATRASAARVEAGEHRQVEVEAEAAEADDLAEDDVQAEPEREVQDHADHRAR